MNGNSKKRFKCDIMQRDLSSHLCYPHVKGKQWRGYTLQELRVRYTKQTTSNQRRKKFKHSVKYDKMYGIWEQQG